MAESPPPTTTMSWSRKKKPSQVAQVDTPWPMQPALGSRPSISDWAPVDTMMLLAEYVGSAASGSPTHTPNGRCDEVDPGDLLGADVGAEAHGLLAHAHHELGAHDAVGEPREVLDLGRQHELATGLVAG